MIDLHMHSTYSDGSDTIEEIIEKALKLNLTQISITDHNNLNGSILASTICPIKYVVGTELSVGYENNEVHLLGYFPNGSNYQSVNYIIKIGEASKAIALAEMIERLNDLGYDVSLNDIKEFGKGVLNRVHICNALMKKGYISSVIEGFQKVIGDDCPAYVERDYVSIQEASKAIHDDGGIAVLAHPYNYKKTKDIPKLLNDVKDLVDGIECFHYSANEEQSTYLVDFASKHHKIITGGSDYHGKNKPHILMNMMQVSDIYQIK